MLEPALDEAPSPDIEAFLRASQTLLAGINPVRLVERHARRITGNETSGMDAYSLASRIEWLLPPLERAKQAELLILEWEPFIIVNDPYSGLAEFGLLDSQFETCESTAHAYALNYVQFLADELSRLLESEYSEPPHCWSVEKSREVSVKVAAILRNSNRVDRLIARLFREQCLTANQFGRLGYVRKAVDDMVTIKDVASLAGLKPRSMTPHIKAWGEPAIPRQGNRPMKFRWSEIRKTVQEQFPHIGWPEHPPL